MLSEYPLTLAPKTLDDADSDARAVLEKAKAQVGFIPNMYARMANSPGLLATYLTATRGSVSSPASPRWTRKSYFSPSAARTAARIA